MSSYVVTMTIIFLLAELDFHTAQQILRNSSKFKHKKKKNSSTLTFSVEKN